MTQTEAAPQDQHPEIDDLIPHNISRKTIFKDREAALRANLLKRKTQKQVRKQDNASELPTTDAKD